MDYDSKFKLRKEYLESESKYLIVIEELIERLSSNTLFTIGDYRRGIIDINFTTQFKKLILKLFSLSSVFNEYIFEKFEDGVLVKINNNFLMYVTECTINNNLVDILMEIDRNES